MNIYIRTFKLPSVEYEARFIRWNFSFTDSYYPFSVFEPHNLPEFDFEPITLFCGDNGCGKSTLLNVVAEYIEAERCGQYNSSEFMPDFILGCEAEVSSDFERSKKLMITSDDVFEYLIDVRRMDAGLDEKRMNVRDEYDELNESNMRLKSMAEYDEYKHFMKVYKSTKPKYVTNNLVNNITMRSNGETAINFFAKNFKNPGLYLIDEPENSLSPKYQLKLKKYIEGLTREGYQFIIATHSPFFLALDYAKIYDLNDWDGKVKKWTELENSKIYYEFFKENEEVFKKE